MQNDVMVDFKYTYLLPVETRASLRQCNIELIHAKHKLMEARVPSFNGEEAELKLAITSVYKTLHVFSRHIIFLPIEFRYTCLNKGGNRRRASVRQVYLFQLGEETYDVKIQPK